jgi:hypothetical protein
MTYGTATSPLLDDPVRTFFPWADEDERLIRHRLINAHYWASARAANDRRSVWSRELYGLIAGLASAHMLCPADKDTLRTVLETNVRLFMAATVLNRLEADHGPE